MEKFFAEETLFFCADVKGSNIKGSNCPCNYRLIISHMRLRKTGPITIGSRVRDTISCAVIPHSVGANSIRVGHETTNCIKT